MEAGVGEATIVDGINTIKQAVWPIGKATACRARNVGRVVGQATQGEWTHGARLASMSRKLSGAVHRQWSKAIDTVGIGTREDV